MAEKYHAIVIGSGPNGFAAAITLARAGRSVLLVEAKETLGGGTRTAELTLPGFRHDVCSAVHPMGLLSPFFKDLPLADFGLKWCHPDVLLAHPLPEGRAVALYSDISKTAQGLPDEDGAAYERIFRKFAKIVPTLLPSLLGPPLRFPKNPVLMAQFGLQAMQSAQGWARSHFRTEQGRALFLGNAAHAILPLDKPFTAAVGLMLMTAGHLVGWPVAQGGSASITQALTNYFHSLGGITRTAFPVRRLADLPEAEHYFFDTTPRALAEICGEALPAAYRQKLQKFRYGAGAFKIDLALSGPIPWLNEACRRAGTVHVGGTAENLLEGERLCYQGRVAAKPYVLLAQQSVVDANRAPAGQHTCWAYCHVPHGWPGDARDAILNHIEEYAPGFRSLILAEHVMRPNDFQNYNANYIGGDIIGGMQDVWQILARPVLRLNPYTTPNPKILLCSSSTPPGGGVHGMCGFHAAQAVLG